MAKNILICDDAAFMRMMIKDILTKNGYNVVGEAENGKIAVDMFSDKPETNPVSIIITAEIKLTIFKDIQQSPDCFDYSLFC